MTSTEDVTRVLEPVLGPAGLVLEDVTVTPAGRRRVARVVVDREVDEPGEGEEGASPVPPLGLDEIADATRLVGDALDASDVMGEQPYTLEVTSPGVDRPLTRPRHFRRNVGRLLRVTLVGGETVTGRLRRVGPTTVVLAPTAEPAKGSRRARETGTEREIVLEAVSRATVEVEFSPPGTPADGEALTETEED